MFGPSSLYFNRMYAVCKRVSFITLLQNRYNVLNFKLGIELRVKNKWRYTSTPTYSFMAWGKVLYTEIWCFCGTELRLLILYEYSTLRHRLFAYAAVSTSTKSLASISRCPCKFVSYQTATVSSTIVYSGF